MQHHLNIAIPYLQSLAKDLTNQRDLEIILTPEKYSSPHPITSDKLFADILLCKTHEELYELLEDWLCDYVDCYTGIILDLLSSHITG